MSLGQRRLKAWPVMNVDGVTATHPDGHHSQSPGIGGVAVGADHHPPGEGVVLEEHLMDDPRARLPEAEAVAGTERRRKS